MPASRTVTARRLAWPVSSLTARPLAPKGAACLDAHEQTLACRVPSSHTSPHAVPVITMAAGQPAGERLPGLGGYNFLQTLYVSPPKGPIPSDWTFRGVGEPGGKVGPGGGGAGVWLPRPGHPEAARWAHTGTGAPGWHRKPRAAPCSRPLCRGGRSPGRAGAAQRPRASARGRPRLSQSREGRGRTHPCECAPYTEKGSPPSKPTARGTAGGHAPPGLPPKLGTPRVPLHGGWPLCHSPAPQHQQPGPTRTSRRGALLCPSRSRTVSVPRDRGSTPVDQVGLGAAPVRRPFPVRPPQRLDVEPVGTHPDVALLQERAGGWGTGPALRGTSWAIVVHSKGHS